jgi:hypothetical protein
MPVVVVALAADVGVVADAVEDLLLDDPQAAKAKATATNRAAAERRLMEEVITVTLRPGWPAGLPDRRHGP